MPGGRGMLKLRTQLRMLVLSAWEPPPGIVRAIAVRDDGTIRVELVCGDEGDGLAFLPDHPIVANARAIFADLDRLAAALLSASGPGPGTLAVTLATLDMQGILLDAACDRIARRTAHR